MIATSIIQNNSCFDKALIQQRFLSAASTYDAHAKVQKVMAHEMVQLAGRHLNPKQANMFEIGCGTGVLTQQILKKFYPQRYICNDLVEEIEPQIAAVVAQNKVSEFTFTGGDAEQINFSPGQNVIWSGATLQWIKNLPAFFDKCAANLGERGYLCVSSFGPENYREIKACTGTGIAYKTKEEVILAASSCFELVEQKEWHQSLWFETPVEVLKHMRQTGVNGVSPCKWTKGDLMNFKQRYKQFAQLQGYPLTYHPFILILKKADC